MAYKVGLMLYLLTIAVCIIIGQIDFFGFPIGAIIGIKFGVISTAIFLIYTLLVSYKSSTTVFRIVLVFILATIVGLYFYLGL